MIKKSCLLFLAALLVLVVPLVVFAAEEIQNADDKEVSASASLLEPTVAPAVNPSTTQPLKFVPDYPKFVVHGEERMRLMWSQEAMDLGANAQPYARDVTVPNTVPPFFPPLIRKTITVDPASNSVSASYLETRDKYVAIFNRFIGTLEMQFNRDNTVITSLENYKVNFGGYKPPREMQQQALRPLDRTTVEEAYLKSTNLLSVDGLTLRAGRQFLDFDFGFLFNGFYKERSFDLVQLTYTNNPWQLSFFYDHPMLDNSRDHFLLENLPQVFGMYTRYKADTWRYSFSFSGTNKDDKFLAPLSFYNQVMWDPVPPVETEADVVYQVGKLDNVEDQHLSTLGLNLILKYKSDLPLHPQFRSEFVLGQGGKDSGEKDFTSIANDTHYGELVKALLKNIYILHSSVSLEVSKHSTLTFAHWYFSQYRSRIDVISNPNLDNGGIRLPTNGIESDLGNEFDIIHDWALLDNLKSSMYIAVFVPGNAFGKQPTLSFPGTQWDVVPFEYRWEILFNF